MTFRSNAPRRRLLQSLAVLPAAAWWTRSSALSTPATTATPPSARTRPFELHGHRGARGLAPENTLAGFARALREGVHALEMDLFMTADDQLVVHHDPQLHPDITRDASGQWLSAPGPLLRSLTLAELQRHDVGRLRPGSALATQFSEQQPADGQRIPTLAEVFAWATRLGPATAALRWNIEIKMHPQRPQQSGNAEQMAQAVLAAVDAAGLRSRAVVQGFDWAPLQVLRRLAPDLALSCLTVRQPRFDNLADGSWTAGLRLTDHADVPRLVQAAGARIWSPSFHNLDAASVQRARALGLQVLPWTVNQPADMARLIDWGVDGLITDYPDRARRVMAEAGLPLPAPVAAA
jgi:glycerophosphoryl diester phosphodiesterase